MNLPDSQVSTPNDGSEDCIDVDKANPKITEHPSLSCVTQKGKENCPRLKSSAKQEFSAKDKQNAISKSTKQVTAKSDERTKLRSPASGPATSPSSASSSKSSQSNRRAQQKGNSNNHEAKLTTIKGQTNNTVCSTLEQFSAKAQEIKKDIYDALEKQSQIKMPDEPIEIVQLKNDILKLSGESQNTDDTNSSGPIQNECLNSASGAGIEESTPVIDKHRSNGGEKTTNNQSNSMRDSLESSTESKPKNEDAIQSQDTSPDLLAPLVKHVQKAKTTEVNSRKLTVESKVSLKNANHSIKTENEPTVASFEPLSAKLDQETKYISLVSSLKRDFEGSPEMLEPICKKLVQMSELISKLQLDCENYDSENKKLLLIKQKLENLCRELQKSNNAIRIESLDLIKLEQGKAKEQTTKIQSTLSSVIKLFDENQQRNMTLRQENQELQTKLRSLLEHCDNWEKGFASALRQRDIENRLLKTELAKANLLKNEEKERFLKEKQDLLQLLSMMQEHQSRIEGQEAKLRSDLSNYASKYDECQAVISKGMSKFQTESRRMLKQIEKSKQDYRVLLTKYESSNKRMAELLDEKQRWDRSLNVANKKIETLEKLCRALRNQKSESSKKVHDPQQRLKALQIDMHEKITKKDEQSTKEIAPDDPISHVEEEKGAQSCVSVDLEKIESNPDE